MLTRDRNGPVGLKMWKIGGDDDDGLRSMWMKVTVHYFNVPSHYQIGGTTGKSQMAQIRIAAVMTEIRTWDVLNKKQEC